MGKRGRPVKSQIRQNMVEIIFYLKKAYGYEIYKTYVKIFPRITLRSIYYHLRKGIATEEFKILNIEKEKGNYSWGPEAEKIYYGLGSAANPSGNERVKEHFNKKTEN